MTIKRQWMLILILTAILSVIINSFVLSMLINSYFVDDSIKNYERNYEQIVEFVRKALSETYTNQQLTIQLETHIIDPIVEIKLFDLDGNLLAHVNNESSMMNSMMKNHMMNRMMGAPAEGIDSVEISDAGILLGRLDVVRYSSVGNSLQSRMFSVALIRNSIFSFVMVLLLMLIVGSVLSRRMSRDLRNTATMATNIDLGNDIYTEKSKVQEIRIIQQSLDTLQSKLKLKQVSRKKMLDELVHQTRTPLTILKTHLEGFEDGVIEMTTEEIKTCEAQIDNITAIISNMSTMIDAEKDIKAIQVEDIEINQLLRQIIGALKVQFDKKQINLSLLSHKKIFFKSDRYILSQSIYNILTNAYKFTEPHGDVSVSYEANETDVIIKIEDTGMGIREVDKAHLFDAYFRSSNTANIPGEGIGLYVVKENMTKIYGDISVESDVGKGSKFILTIPNQISL